MHTLSKKEPMKKCSHHNIKIKLSLTRKRSKTLTHPDKIGDKLVPNVNFLYTDIHGNPKL